MEAQPGYLGKAVTEREDIKTGYCVENPRWAWEGQTWNGGCVTRPHLSVERDLRPSGSN